MAFQGVQQGFQGQGQQGQQGNLQVRVISLQGLENKEFLTKNDPYVMLKFGRETRKTTAKNSAGRGAQFNETFTFPWTADDQYLHVWVYDDDPVKDDLIGECEIPLRELTQGGSRGWDLISKKLGIMKKRTGFITLEGAIASQGAAPGVGMASAAGVPGGGLQQGGLQQGFQGQGQQGNLQVRVINLRGLDNKEFLTKNDPYVMLRFGRETRKTTVKNSAGQGAQFNETFTFPWTADDQYLRVWVYDDDPVKDDMIGECEIPLRELTQGGPRGWELISKKLGIMKKRTGIITLEGAFTSQGAVPGVGMASAAGVPGGESQQGGLHHGGLLHHGGSHQSGSHQSGLFHHGGLHHGGVEQGGMQQGGLQQGGIQQGGLQQQGDGSLVGKLHDAGSKMQNVGHEVTTMGGKVVGTSGVGQQPIGQGVGQGVGAGGFQGGSQSQYQQGGLR